MPCHWRRRGPLQMCCNSQNGFLERPVSHICIALPPDRSTYVVSVLGQVSDPTGLIVSQRDCQKRRRGRCCQSFLLGENQGTWHLHSTDNAWKLILAGPIESLLGAILQQKLRWREVRDEYYVFGSQRWYRSGSLQAY